MGIKNNNQIKILNLFPDIKNKKADVNAVKHNIKIKQSEDISPVKIQGEEHYNELLSNKDKEKINIVVQGDIPFQDKNIKKFMKFMNTQLAGRKGMDFIIEQNGEKYTCEIQRGNWQKTRGIVYTSFYFNIYESDKQIFKSDIINVKDKEQRHISMGIFIQDFTEEDIKTSYKGYKLFKDLYAWVSKNIVI